MTDPEAADRAFTRTLFGTGTDQSAEPADAEPAAAPPTNIVPREGATSPNHGSTDLDFVRSIFN